MIERSAQMKMKLKLKLDLKLKLKMIRILVISKMSRKHDYIITSTDTSTKAA